MAVTVTNNSGETVFQNGQSSDFGSGWVSGWGSGFNYGASSCISATLAPGDTCTLNVQFTPTATGKVTGTLSLNFSGVASPYDDYAAKFAVSGTGYLPKQ